MTGDGAALVSAPPLATASERRLAGQERRAILPRSAHAAWVAPPGRGDPVTMLLDREAGLLPALLPVRHARMAADVFGFFRGSACIMAADFAARPDSGLDVFACGDAHLGNFGVIADGQGRAVFDIVDFDEAAPAAFEFDVLRLATSLVMAGRLRGLMPKATRSLARRVAHGYRRHMDQLAAYHPLDIWRSHINLEQALADIPDRDTRRRERHRVTEAVDAARQGYTHLLGDGPTLRLPERPPLVSRLPDCEAEARVAFADYAAKMPEDRRLLLDRYRLRDVAFKAVGIGSLGTFCALGLFASADGDVLLLQLKEARPSVLRRAHAAPAWPDDAERVAAAHRAMAATSDLFLGTAHAAGRGFAVRTLADPRLAGLRAAMEDEALRFYAQLCGRTLARAHARTGDAAMIAGYLGEGEAFDDAVATFAHAYAAQVDSDFAAWTQAVRDKRVPVA